MPFNFDFLTDIRVFFKTNHIPWTVGRVIWKINVVTSDLNYLEGEGEGVRVCGWGWGCEVYTYVAEAPKYVIQYKIYICPRWDPNPRPSDNMSAALPTKLHGHIHTKIGSGIHSVLWWEEFHYSERLNQPYTTATLLLSTTDDESTSQWGCEVYTYGAEAPKYVIQYKI